MPGPQRPRASRRQAWGNGAPGRRHVPLPTNPVTERDLEVPASQTAGAEAPWEGAQRSAAMEAHTGAANLDLGCRKQYL